MEAYDIPSTHAPPASRAASRQRGCRHQDVGALGVGRTLPVVAMGRHDLAKLLAQPSHSGPLPVEFCILGVNPPNLPEPERRRRSR